MSRRMRTLLTVLAVTVVTFATIDPVGVPVWVQAIVAALGTGLAAVGIIPPTMTAWKTPGGNVFAERDRNTYPTDPER